MGGAAIILVATAAKSTSLRIPPCKEDFVGPLLPEYRRVEL